MVNHAKGDKPMNSDEIARTFYNQGLSNKWLSKKQSEWLYNQACREAKRHITRHGTPTANGLFNLEDGTAIGWEIAISPINRCTVLQTRNVSELMQKQEAERAAQIEGGKQFIQNIKGTPFEDHYPPELIARMYKVSVAQVKEWFTQIDVKV